MARRPHGQHTTVVVHVDVDKPAATLHLGPLLTDGERQYLSCDATCEVWFERADWWWYETFQPQPPPTNN